MKRILFMCVLCLGTGYVAQTQTTVAAVQRCKISLWNNQWLIRSLGMTYPPQSQFRVATSKSCNVGLLKGHWLVQSYGGRERIILTKSSKDIISVHETGDIAGKENTKGRIPFKIAILKKSTQTTVPFSNTTFEQLDVNEVLRKAEPEDTIIILLQDSHQYSLPQRKTGGC